MDFNFRETFHIPLSEVKRRNSNVHLKFADCGQDYVMNAYDLIKGNISTYVIHLRKYYRKSYLVFIFSS